MIFLTLWKMTPQNRHNVQLFYRKSVFSRQPLALKLQPKVGLLRPKIMPKHFQTPKKVQKTNFSTHKMVKTWVSTWQKVSILGAIFDLRAQLFFCWYWKKIKSFSLIAKDILKKEEILEIFKKTAWKYKKWLYLPPKMAKTWVPEK